LQTSMRAALTERIENNERRLENLVNRISPLKLASRLHEKKTRLALLRQKNVSAIKDAIDGKDERLKIKMASLDALSPLSVLRRGFSIVQTDAGEILRDAKTIKIGDEVKILPARGKLKARVLEVGDER